VAAGEASVFVAEVLAAAPVSAAAFTGGVMDVALDAPLVAAGAVDDPVVEAAALDVAALVTCVAPEGAVSLVVAADFDAVVGCLAVPVDAPVVLAEPVVFDPGPAFDAGAPPLAALSFEVPDAAEAAAGAACVWVGSEAERTLGKAQTGPKTMVSANRPLRRARTQTRSVSARLSTCIAMTGLSRC
jgi:hypothetical protein